MTEDVRAHITGVVFQIVAGAGSEVGAGDAILILESMKMEHSLRATTTGSIAEVRTSVGSTVKRGDTLVLLA